MTRYSPSEWTLHRSLTYMLTIGIITHIALYYRLPCLLQPYSSLIFPLLIWCHRCYNEATGLDITGLGCDGSPPVRSLFSFPRYGLEWSSASGSLFMLRLIARLVFIWAGINAKSSYSRVTTGACRNRCLNQSFHGYEPSALPRSYPSIPCTRQIFLRIYLTSDLFSLIKKEPSSFNFYKQYCLVYEIC